MSSAQVKSDEKLARYKNLLEKQDALEIRAKNLMQYVGDLQDIINIGTKLEKKQEKIDAKKKDAKEEKKTMKLI